MALPIVGYAAIGIFASQALYFQTLSYLDVALALVLSYIAPLPVAIYQHVRRGERLPRYAYAVMVVAVGGDSPYTSVDQLPQGVRVSTEYPELTKRFFAAKGIDADIRLSYGASEAKIPDIADCIVDITETGRALRDAGLRIIEEMLQSYTEVVANKAAYADPAKRHAMGQLMTLLNGTLDARGKVLVKMSVAAESLNAVLALVPSLKSPTVNPLAGDGGFAVETVVAKSQINTLIPALVDAGATGILELPISKIIP